MGSHGHALHLENCGIFTKRRPVDLVLVAPEEVYGARVAREVDPIDAIEVAFEQRGGCWVFGKIEPIYLVWVLFEDGDGARVCRKHAPATVIQPVQVLGNDAHRSRTGILGQFKKVPFGQHGLVCVGVKADVATGDEAFVL